MLPSVGSSAATIFPEVAVNSKLRDFAPSTLWKPGAVVDVPMRGTPTRGLCQSTTPASDACIASVLDIKRMSEHSHSCLMPKSSKGATVDAVANSERSIARVHWRPTWTPAMRPAGCRYNFNCSRCSESISSRGTSLQGRMHCTEANRCFSSYYAPCSRVSVKVTDQRNTNRQAFIKRISGRTQSGSENLRKKSLSVCTSDRGYPSRRASVDDQLVLCLRLVDSNCQALANLYAEEA